MRLLVLGGTSFVGRHAVEQALARGHELTLFHRGKTNPGLFPGARELQGDRDGGLDALAEGRWDAVLDTSGYLPRVVRASAQSLAGRAGHYAFVSSVSVYPSFPAPGTDESFPVGELDDPASEDVGKHYGPLKVGCEREVEAAFRGRTLVVRPGLIVGPHDPTDRFGYWPARADRGGELLAPAPPERQVQFIDVRDLAAWMLAALERGLAGTFNAAGPRPGPTFAELIEACIKVANRDARPVWADPAFLLEQGVAPWMDLPLWIPAGDPEHAFMQNTSSARAEAEGLRFRPLEDTVRATLEWLRGERPDRPWRAGLTPEREAELLAAWHERGAGAR